MLGLVKSLSILFPSVLAGFEHEKHDTKNETDRQRSYKHRTLHIILLRKSYKLGSLAFHPVQRVGWTKISRFGKVRGRVAGAGEQVPEVQTLGTTIMHSICCLVTQG